MPKQMPDRFKILSGIFYCWKIIYMSKSELQSAETLFQQTFAQPKNDFKSVFYRFMNKIE